MAHTKPIEGCSLFGLVHLLKMSLLEVSVPVVLERRVEEHNKS